jgi:hypothetical protein
VLDLIETCPGGGGQALTCSTLGPFAAKLQPACNTRFEFVFDGPAHLDKIAIWQHAGAHVLNQKSCITQVDRIRRVWDWGSI